MRHSVVANRLIVPVLRTLAMAVVLIQAPVALAAGPVNVLYAGSLVNLMEHGVGPAFDKATGNSFQGFAGGSGLLANQIKGKLRHGDVFVSASPKVVVGGWRMSLVASVTRSELKMP